MYRINEDKSITLKYDEDLIKESKRDEIEAIFWATEDIFYPTDGSWDEWGTDYLYIGYCDYTDRIYYVSQNDRDELQDGKEVTIQGNIPNDSERNWINISTIIKTKEGK